GQCFDWSLIQGLKLQRDFILAGGLDAENVQEALDAVNPYAVDVNSGVETAPRQKGHELIREFIRRVRACEQG
ncbi:N-(5'-phosphoribosyl)anthranilate isomerase, partial [Desulfobulbus sp. N2]|nr:N-(5'-phosphoribosyl)anthranilate isomerase [Desulfobulbus sp. N2]